MAKWNASVGLQLSIDYDDIEADTEEEAEQIAKDRALEDIDWNNCECCEDCADDESEFDEVDD